jgi:hypothetical protein
LHNLINSGRAFYRRPGFFAPDMAALACTL